jgi:hypothetical protein
MARFLGVSCAKGAATIVNLETRRCYRTIRLRAPVVPSIASAACDFKAACPDWARIDGSTACPVICTGIAIARTRGPIVNKY